MSKEDGLSRLKFDQTWDVGGDEDLIVFFETLSLRQKLSNLWNRIKGKPYTGRGSSVLSSARATESTRFMERAMGIEPTSEAWEVLNIPIPFSSQRDARPPRV